VQFKIKDTVEVAIHSVQSQLLNQPMQLQQENCTNCPNNQSSLVIQATTDAKVVGKMLLQLILSRLAQFF
jgi:hypothetical protein